MEEIIALVIILSIAFMFAPLGLGGGFLFVPTLYFILGWELQLSIVCSLILVWFVSIGSRRAHDEGGYTVAGVGRKGRIVAIGCLLYTSPRPRDDGVSRMPSSA